MNEAIALPAENPLGLAGENLSAEFRYDGFLSYSTRADYKTARRLEAFLESFHKFRPPRGAALRRLQICRDGSDFRLPRERAKLSEAQKEEVWSIIEPELAAARHLLVLCSLESVTSGWMRREIDWYLQNRGPDALLLVITGAAQPEVNPETCVPEQLIRAGLTTRRIWCDLRALGATAVSDRVRDAEDEMVRLAGDLLEWDSVKFGPLLAAWEREQLRLQRRNAAIALAVGVALCVGAGMAIWEALAAKQQTVRARANALTAAVETMSDPLLGGLVLSAAARDAKPEHGHQLALTLAAKVSPVARIRAHASAIEALAVNEKSSLLASAGDGEIKLWRLNGSSEPRKINFGAPVTSLEFDVSGARLIATGANRFSVGRSTGEPISAPALRAGGYVRATFLQHGEAVVALAEYGAITVSFPGANRADVTLTPPGTRRAVAIWPGDASRPALIATDDLTFWRLDLDVKPPRLALHAARPPLDDFPDSLIDKIWFSKSGRRALAIFADLVLVLDTQGELVSRLRHPASVNSATFGLDDREILTACSDGKARIYREGDQKPSEYDPGPQNLKALGFDQSNVEGRIAAPMSRAVWNARGDGFLSQSEDGATRLWTRNQAESWQPLAGHVGADHILVAKPDGSAESKEIIVTGADDGTLRVWESPARLNPRVVTSLEAVDRAQFNANGSRFALVSRDGAEQVCDTDSNSCFRLGLTGRKNKTFAFHTTDDSLLATGYADGGVQLWKLRQRDAEAQEVLTQPHSSSVIGLRFTRDGSTLISWSEDNSLFARRMRERDAIVLLPASTDKIWSVDVSPDGALVVAGFESGKTLLWSLAEGPTPRVLGEKSGLSHGGTVFCVAFDGASKHVVSASKDGTAVTGR